MRRLNWFYSTRRIKCDAVELCDDLRRIIRRNSTEMRQQFIRWSSVASNRMHKLLKLYFYPTIQRFPLRVSHDSLIFKMASGQQACVQCDNVTKYKCIRCDSFVCNRSTCSVAEIDEDTDGWVENVSVGYCSSAILPFWTTFGPTHPKLCPTRRLLIYIQQIKFDV